ncbi:MAG: VanW family protein [Bacteroidia bacterium]
MSRQELTEKHSLVNATLFRLKTFVLTGNRVFKNLLSPTRKFKDKGQLINKPVIAFSENDLWNPFDNRDNWILTAGKIENLRISAKKLNGLEIKANEVFSFWKHIGNPNFGQGFVVGREIREGCIVPTIAGGLCQLSNALYDAALKADFDIIERHRHTKVIKGSLAEQDRDATVKWNYIDLRFKSSFDFRIETELTADKLVVCFRSKQKNVKATDDKFDLRHSNKLNDCYSCGNFACFKHPDRTSVKQEVATTTFILDEKWPEYDTYITETATPSDSFILPLKKNRFIKTDRYSWTSANPEKTKTTDFQGIYRALKLRFAPKNKNNVFELGLHLDKKIALASAKLIPIDSTHVVISQNLLPFIYETGALGGRTFDVLMTRLPFEKLHERLDLAFNIHSESPTLKDFRADKELIETENKALTKARKIITPHSEIAEIFKNKVVKLNWHTPLSTNGQTPGNKVLFPASAVGRKGAYEIRRLAKELNLNLTISGRAIEKANFWEDLHIEMFNGDLQQIGLIVYPTFIEHQPRQILKALSNGVKVVTTSACGLDRSDLVEIVEINNFEQLKNAVKQRTERK